jgi:hypothetical protein
MSGKDEIQKLVETLRAQNIDLQGIRKQRESSKKNSKPRFRKDLEHSPNPDAVLAKVLQIREISKTLYQSLAATAGCHCHRVNLELQGFPEQINSPAGSLPASKATKFRLVLSNDSDSNGSDPATECHCTSIIINSEFDPVLESAPRSVAWTHHAIHPSVCALSLQEMKTETASHLSKRLRQKR